MSPEAARRQADAVRTDSQDSHSSHQPPTRLRLLAELIGPFPALAPLASYSLVQGFLNVRSALAFLLDLDLVALETLARFIDAAERVGHRISVKSVEDATTRRPVHAEPVRPQTLTFLVSLPVSLVDVVELASVIRQPAKKPIRAPLTALDAGRREPSTQRGPDGHLTKRYIGA